MTREMVTVKHDGIEGTARVPKTALKQMKGWEVVDEGETAAASSAAGDDAPAGDEANGDQAPAGDASTQSAADKADTPSRSRKGATQQKEQ